MDYLRYDELTSQVQALAMAYPTLCGLQAIGQSPEGRSIWALTVTSSEGGPSEEKPALLLEGNIHAGEVTASAAALFTVKRLLESYGQDRAATRLLDRSVLYVVPRLAVDGAEFYLTTPQMVRSSPLPYPDEVPPAEGLIPEDLDGDGRIRLMRRQDPLGEFKLSERDPRIMVRRQPEDWEGPFYKLYPEGTVLTPAGREVQAVTPVKPNRGLDFNRNFPAHWNPEAKQPGAGRYPLDQAETRAMAEFMVSHPNISIYLALHTSGGVLLRPPSLGADEQMNAADLRLFEALGDLCFRTTTYPCRSSYHAFFHTPGQPLVKGSKDWAYEHLGMVAYTMELWDLDARAGAHAYRDLGARGLNRLTDAQREEDEWKRLQWNDAELDGTGFKDWTSFQHPVLGQVEIGGWDEKSVRQNCPARFLPEECRRVSEFVLKLGLTLPHLEIGQVRVTPLDAAAWRIEAEVQNSGFLSTVTTRAAVAQKAVKPAEATLTLAEGATLLAGRPTQRLGQLDGYSSVQDPAFNGLSGPIRSALWVEWAVSAQPGSEVTISAKSPRGGHAERVVRLG